MERWNASTANIRRLQWPKEMRDGPRLSLSFYKEGIGCTPAELVFGSNLRLPGEIFSESSIPLDIDSTSYASSLKQCIRYLKATPTRFRGLRSQIHPDLQSAPFVFIRVDIAHPTLFPPCDGPYKVLQRHANYFVIDRSKDTVSIDRLKEAYLEECKSIDAEQIRYPNSQLFEQSQETLPASPTSAFSTTLTWAGRRIRSPVQFADYVHTVISSALGGEYCGGSIRVRP